MGNPLPNPFLRIDSNVQICFKIQTGLLPTAGTCLAFTGHPSELTPFAGNLQTRVQDQQTQLQ